MKYHFKDLNVNDLEKYRINNLPFRGCIKINDNYIALSSNSILPNGKDILYIYDTNTKRFIKNLNYSFEVGVNGLHLMKFFEEDNKTNNKKKNKLLLCACKKYKDSQKNGIIIIDTNINEEEELYYIFHDTDDFEVCCFCPLKIKKDNKMITTNYFLAGGLEEEKKQGIIKLYRVHYNENEEDDKINVEYLQDIVVETNNKFEGINSNIENQEDDKIKIDNLQDIVVNNKFEGFNSNIECIMQRKSDGKIYVSSSDGNLSLFSEPNLDYYLEEGHMLEELSIQLSSGN